MWKDSETEIDLLHFDYLVKAVKMIAEDTNLTPSTIGIYGDWGSGKSSLMKMVCKELSDKEGIKCINVNGWLFEGYDDVRTSLCGTILDELSHDIKYCEKIKDELKSLIKSVDVKKVLAKGTKYGLDFLLTGGIGTLTEFTLDGIVSRLKSKAVEVNEEDLKKIIDSLSKNDSKRNEIKNFRKEFGDMLEKSDINNLVIFIDELDRCQPDTILDIFEAIRLFLFVDGITFIIGADERLVQYAIKTKYQDVPGGDLDIGKEYLEKFIQYPITIPQLTENGVSHYITSLLVQNTLNKCEYKKYLEIVYSISDDSPIDYGLIKEKQDEELANKCRDAIGLSEQISSVLAQILNGNPRQCKRFLNTLYMRLYMAEVRKANLDKNILAKLMLVEYFRPQFFKEMFNPERFNDLKELEKRKELSDKNALKNWSQDKDAWLGRWFESCPSLPDDYNELSKYLFYSRDKFRYGRSVLKSLGERVRKCFDLLMTKSQANITKASTLAEELSPAEVSGLEDAMVSEMNKSEIWDDELTNFILELNYNLGLQDNSVDILLSTSLDKIPQGSIPYIVEKTNESVKSEKLMDYLKTNNMLKNAVENYQRMKN